MFIWPTYYCFINVINVICYKCKYTLIYNFGKPFFVVVKFVFIFVLQLSALELNELKCVNHNKYTNKNLFKACFCIWLSYIMLFYSSCLLFYSDSLKYSNYAHQLSTAYNKFLPQFANFISIGHIAKLPFATTPTPIIPIPKMYLNDLWTNPITMFWPSVVLERTIQHLTTRAHLHIAFRLFFAGVSNQNFRNAQTTGNIFETYIVVGLFCIWISLGEMYISGIFGLNLCILSIWYCCMVYGN